MTDPAPHCSFWEKVVFLLKEALETIPCGFEPEQKYYFDHPDEEWKNQIEKEALESEYYEGTSDYIRMFCTRHKWPGRYKEAVPYYARRRLIWARNYLRVLLTPSPANGDFVVPDALIPPDEFLCWLLTDAYDHRNPPTSGN